MKYFKNCVITGQNRGQDFQLELCLTSGRGRFAMALTDRQTDKQTPTENQIKKTCANLLFAQTEFCENHLFLIICKTKQQQKITKKKQLLFNNKIIC